MIRKISICVAPYTKIFTILTLVFSPVPLQANPYLQPSASWKVTDSYVNRIKFTKSGREIVYSLSRYKIKSTKSGREIAYSFSRDDGGFIHLRNIETGAFICTWNNYGIFEYVEPVGNGMIVILKQDSRRLRSVQTLTLQNIDNCNSQNLYSKSNLTGTADVRWSQNTGHFSGSIVRGNRILRTMFLNGFVLKDMGDKYRWVEFTAKPYHVLSLQVLDHSELMVGILDRSVGPYGKRFEEGPDGKLRYEVDGPYIGLMSVNGVVKTWNMHSSVPNYYSFDVSHDGKYIVFYDDKDNLNLISSKKLDSVYSESLKPYGDTHNLKFVPNSYDILSVSGDGLLCLWRLDFDKLKLVFSKSLNLKPAFKYGSENFAVSNDGKRIALVVTENISSSRIVIYSNVFDFVNQ